MSNRFVYIYNLWVVVTYVWLLNMYIVWLLICMVTYVFIPIDDRSPRLSASCLYHLVYSGHVIKNLSGHGDNAFINSVLYVSYIQHTSSGNYCVNRLACRTQACRMRRLRIVHCIPDMHVVGGD